MEALKGLSPRHLQVWEMLAQGHSNQVIGDRMGLAKSTVKRYTQELYGHLGIPARAEGRNQRVLAAIAWRPPWKL